MHTDRMCELSIEKHGMNEGKCWTTHTLITTGTLGVNEELYNLKSFKENMWRDKLILSFPTLFYFFWLYVERTMFLF